MDCHSLTETAHIQNFISVTFCSVKSRQSNFVSPLSVVAVGLWCLLLYYYQVLKRLRQKRDEAWL